MAWERAGGRTPLHVIVVDDEFLVALMFERALEESGFRVSIARNGREALDIHQADPAVAVVTDLRMPGMGGVELLRRLRERWPALPVLVVSGWPVDDGVPRPGGATAFLAKPVSPTVVAKRVSALVPACPPSAASPSPLWCPPAAPPEPVLPFRDRVLRGG